ncbi:hypothetical protein ACFL2Q_04605 [Thermodesulfobacteriota bacterium]
MHEPLQNDGHLITDYFRTSKNTKLKPEKTARQIRMKLGRKRRLIDPVVEAESIPDSTVTQAFLIPQLYEREGVGFVDIRTLPVRETNPGQTAEGGTILISDKTYERMKNQVAVAARGEARLKGLRAVRKLYAVEAIAG